MSQRSLLAAMLAAAVLFALGAAARAADRDDPATRADRVEARALALRTHLASELDQARVARDRLRERCLDRTLAEVHALLRLTWRQREMMASTGGPRSARTDSAVSVLERRLGELRRDMRTCAGEPEVVADQRTIVTTTRDADVPVADPTVLEVRRSLGTRRFWER